MMLAKSLQSAAGNAAGEAVYIEDVMSTFLYTGNGSTQTITNGIDLAGEGGLVWIKQRNEIISHTVVDTARGNTKIISTNNTGAQGTYTTAVTGFNSNGFSLGNDSDWGGSNTSSGTYASWTFRKQPKFFDVVTWIGTGANNNVPHNLDSAPGCILIKRTDSTGDWLGWHRNAGVVNQAFAELSLNKTNAPVDGAIFSQNTVTSTTFNPQDIYEYSGNYTANESGATYVAYLFAHNAGGFGLSGEDNVISCGSFTTDGSGNATVSLGYEPQWLMIKRTNAAENWIVVDNMRGWPVGNSDDAVLNPNTSGAENNTDTIGFPTATGFNYTLGSASSTFIYIAIRRGPMKVPTTGTSVFQPIVRTGTGANVTVTGAGFAPDLVATACRDFNGFGYYDKLRGALRALRPSQTSAEATYTTTLTGFTNNGYTAGSNSDGFGEINGNTDPYVNHMFSRAPGFFDEVCYTGTGSARTVAHNLTVVPELMIVKIRNEAQEWDVYAAPLGATKYLRLDSTFGANVSSSRWNNTTPSSTNFTVGTDAAVNANTYNYVAYLFASAPGVSKVGSYTGTAATLQINCGFTAGARFVLIKRTDDDGFAWYVWDSARGIVAGDDPYLLLNSTAAEVTNTDYIDTYSAGFEITSTAPAAINASGGTFVFLAIA